MNGVLQEIATEIVMKKVAEDKMKQMEQEERLRRKRERESKCEKEDSDSDFEVDEEELDILKRMKEDQIQNYHEKLKQKEADTKASVWAGEYNEIKEDQFLNIVTKNKLVVCHFYHTEFQRCKIVDHHLKTICKYHPETVFVSLNSEKTPFFIQKLAIRVLPTICLFKDGILVDKIVGFEELGGDDFKSSVLARRIIGKGVMIVRIDEEKAKFIIKGKSKNDDSDSD